jgi:phosphopantetheinyl transferase (holo-ACP synthase)
MSAKDKAIELMDKYQYAVRFDESETQYFANMHSVKECALIAVDEIIKQCWDYRDIDLQASYDYWQEVKQQIELL